MGGSTGQGEATMNGFRHSPTCGFYAGYKDCGGEKGGAPGGGWFDIRAPLGFDGSMFDRFSFGSEILYNGCEGQILCLRSLMLYVLDSFFILFPPYDTIKTLLPIIIPTSFLPPCARTPLAVKCVARTHICFESSQTVPRCSAHTVGFWESVFIDWSVGHQGK